MDNNVVRISMLMGATEKQSVVCEALLTDLEEGVTTQGKPFVKGMLIDGRNRMIFKHWDIDLDTMRKKYNLPDRRSFVVQVSGILDIYEDVPQVIAKGGMAPVTREGAVDDYADTAPYPVDGMLEIVQTIVGRMESPDLKMICEKFLEMVSDKIMYQPFSCEVHEEKAGWLHHTYNLLALSASENGLPKLGFLNENGTTTYISLIDREVCIAAFVCYSISSFDMILADPDTGAVEDKDIPEIAMNGGLHGYHNVSKVHDIIESFDPNDIYHNRVCNLEHIVAVLNGITDAVTPEAYYAVNLCNLEKQTYKAAKISQTIGFRETTKVALDGAKHTVIRTA